LDRFTEVIQLYASSKAECEQQGFEPHLDLAILTLRSDVSSKENIRKPCQSLAGKTREKCKFFFVQFIAIQNGHVGSLEIL
jgi:hypothetical protein